MIFFLSKYLLLAIEHEYFTIPGYVKYLYIYNSVELLQIYAYSLNNLIWNNEWANNN